MTDIALLRIANAKRWSAAHSTRDFKAVARHLIDPAAKKQYLEVEAATGVPWPVIAVIHEREASQSWRGSLAQGDDWSKVSINVPAGRGPFNSWHDAAVDALMHCPPFAGHNRDWSIGGALTVLEQYNGLGYFTGPVTRRNGVVIARYPSQASPYVWSGTDQYVRGKYTRDGFFDPDAVDKQLGCAGLLMAMMDFDPTITFTGLTLKPVSPVMPPPRTVPQASPPPPGMPPPPSITNPAKGSVGAFIAGLFSKLFGRRS